MLLYRFIRFITFPFYWAALKIQGKENRERSHERLGHPTEDRPKGDLVWLHVSDFDESLDIVRGIMSAMPHRAILLTYNTRSEDSRIQYGAGIICQYAPIDTKLTVNNFLRFWEPSLAIRTGAELKPFHLLLLKKYEIPSFLINGELSDKSYRRWKLIKRTAKKILRNFTFVWALNNKQTLKFANLGVGNIESQDLPAGNKIKDILHKIKNK